MPALTSVGWHERATGGAAVGLTIIRVDASDIGFGAAVELVRDALAESGRVTVLVPSFVQGLDLQRTLADAGLSLGVTATTPEVWARELWALWGTGERVISTAAASIVMCEVLDDAGRDASPGLVRLLCRLARQALPWLPLLPDGSVDVRALPCKLSSAELDALGLVGRYRRRLRTRHLIEMSEVMAGVPDAVSGNGIDPGPLVVLDFPQMTRAQCELLAGIARRGDVRLVVHAAEAVDGAGSHWRDGVSTGSGLAGGIGHVGGADGSARALVDVGSLGLGAGVGVDGAIIPAQFDAVTRLIGCATGHGVDVTFSDAPSGTDSFCAHIAPTAQELHALHTSFLTASDAGEVMPSGAVRLLEAAGPLAEAELVVRELVDVAADGATSLVVVSTDAVRLWRELSPKLVARGISVSACLSVPFEKTEAGKAFSSFMRSVARLSELAEAWPQDEGGVRHLADMSWWPPRDVVDFLLSGIAHVDGQRSARLDAAWRSNRLLSPADVLAALLSAKETSVPVERATRELLRGRLGSAASRLLSVPLAEDAASTSSDAAPDVTYAQLEATSVLGVMLDASGTLRELGITADPKAADAISLIDLVERVLVILGDASVTVRPSCDVAGAPCSVRIMAPSQAALLAPRSTDAVVVCGLTSDEWPMERPEDLCEELLAELGIEGHVEQGGRQRALFSRIIALPRRALSLERTLFAATSHERYPSPLLTELRACYASESLPLRSRGEQPGTLNVLAKGEGRPAVGKESRSPAGRIGKAARQLVIVPPEGSLLPREGIPLLSASQIESYLECPLKWFSLRRLRLQDADAGCGPPEMGTFAHRVLELSRRAMLAEGLDALAADDLRTASIMATLAGIEDVKAFASPEPSPLPDELVRAMTCRVESSTVKAGDEAALGHARALLEQAFDEHLAHQYLLEGGHAHFQALVAHSARERSAVEGLRRDLVTLLDYESVRLAGFEPRLFEWDFGGKRHPVTYAGVSLVGTIDRLDVDAHGQAVVIDYKHKGTAGFVAEHAAFGKDGVVRGGPPVLPRHVQALIYAQVVRRAFPGLRVVGALYLGTKGDHALAGALSANVAERVMGTSATKATLARVSMPDDETLGGAEGASTGMDALLDATEDAIAERIGSLRSGNIEAHPMDALACRFCPVLGCERRLA